MDLSLGVAMGSATQIALFVVPFTVIAGWILQVPMTLEFSIFESAVLFISVFLVNGFIYLLFILLALLVMDAQIG